MNPAALSLQVHVLPSQSAHAGEEQVEYPRLILKGQIGKKAAAVVVARRLE
jgi:hypothetical protein